MKINKNVMKKAGIGLASLSLGLGALYGGYSLSQHHALAENDQVKVSNETKDKLVNQATEASVLSAVFAKMNDAHENNEKLSQEELDGLTFYIVSYYESGRIFMSDGVINSAEAGVSALESLYKQSEVEPSFSRIKNEDGTESIKLVRDIHKPDNFDNIVKIVKNAVEDQVEKSKSSGKVDVSVDVSQDDLLIDK